MDVLHVAPEPCIAPLFDGSPRYVTADLDMPGVAIQADLTDMPMADQSFDLIICSHVLEHVRQDERAMAELVRLLRREGLLILMIPRDRSRARTLEDSSIDTPAGRLRHFGQEDHVRVYGSDFEQRLRSAGLGVRVETAAQAFEPEAIARHGVLPDEEVFACSRAAIH